VIDDSVSGDGTKREASVLVVTHRVLGVAQWLSGARRHMTRGHFEELYQG